VIKSIKESILFQSFTPLGTLDDLQLAFTQCRKCKCVKLHITFWRTIGMQNNFVTHVHYIIVFIIWHWAMSFENVNFHYFFQGKSMCKNLVKFTKTTLHAIEFNIRHDFNSHNRRKSIQAKLKKTCKQFFLLKPSSKKSCQTHGENLVITKIQGINSKPWENV
jgi:hypothetical protein